MEDHDFSYPIIKPEKRTYTSRPEEIGFHVNARVQPKLKSMQVYATNNEHGMPEFTNGVTAEPKEPTKSIFGNCAFVIMVLLLLLMGTMAAFGQEFKSINGVNYTDTGSGAPLVWLHGIGEINGTAKAIADYGILKKVDYVAPEGVRIICVQFNSSNPVTQAERVAQLIKDLKIKPLLVGWSFGGAVANHFVKKYQDFITGYVSISMADINDSGLEAVTIPARYAHAENDAQGGCPVRGSDEAFAKISSPDKFYFRFPTGNHGGPPSYVCSPSGLKYGSVYFNLYDWCKQLAQPVVVDPDPVSEQWYINGKPTGITDTSITSLERKQ